ncbi:MAG: porin [Proteobacteria bacterium]|nr:porin [Pseudomonadota bacterium]
MKKSLIALAVLAASGAAMAQSSVTLYGVVDEGVTYVNGKQNWTGLTSGNQLTSRLGVRGSEDLGGGLKANFRLEGGINADTGNGKVSGASGNGFEFKRQSTVGLEGGFGEVRLGRELTAAYNAVARYDPFGSVGLANSRLWADGGLPADNTNVPVNGAKTTNQRVSNAVTYVTPNFSGFKAGLNYGFGEVPGHQSDSRYIGGGLMYDNGPISVGLSGETLKSGANTRATGNINAWSLGGSYDFGVAKVLAGYRQSKAKNFYANGNDNKREGYMLAVTAPVGPGLVKVAYNHYEDKGGATTAKADQLGLGYVYSLSKRTSLYGTYAYLKNKNNGNTFSLSGDTAVKDNGKQQGLQVGITHTF